jgi:ankyrin repeat protein
MIFEMVRFIAFYKNHKSDLFMSFASRCCVFLCILCGCNLHLKNSDKFVPSAPSTYLDKSDNNIIELQALKNSTLQAARECDLEKMQQAIETDYSLINYADDANLTLLHWACANGHLEVVKFLVENGADIEAKDKSGRTPILLNSSTDIAKYLVSKGADFKITSKDGYSVLHQAAFYGKIELLKFWIGMRLNPEVNYKNGGTPLLCAASFDQKEAVEYLLSVGANIDAVDEKGECILHKAADATDWSLFDKDPNYFNSTRNTGKTLKFLLDKGMDANSKDSKGDTPLHKVVYYRTRIAAEMLISYGAKVNAQNNMGQTPLYIASGYKDNIEMTKLLIENGADINLRTKNNASVLHNAVGEGNYDTIKYLLEKGAEVNICLTDGGTPLHSAAAIARPDLVKLLLDYGADVNARDNRRNIQSRVLWPSKNTPLHRAVEQANNSEVVKILIAKGSDIYAQNSAGKTPLDLAIEHKYQDIVDILKKYSQTK